MFLIHPFIKNPVYLFRVFIGWEKRRGSRYAQFVSIHDPSSDYVHDPSPTAI